MLKRTSRWAFALLLLIVTAACPALAADSLGQLGKAKVNGVELGYRIYGSGQPLLMITGYGATMDSWDAELLGRLAARYLVIVFDNRGMGYSAINGDNLTIKLMASCRC